MSVTSSQLRSLNRRFGQAFGFNPHGQPNFRWARTEEMFFFIDHGVGLVQKPSSLMAWEPRYERKSWVERYGRCWILTKWKHYTEEEWYSKVRNAMPYPRHGDWEPVENVRLGPDYPEHPPEPNDAATQEAIEAIRFHRTRAVEDIVNEPDIAHRLAIKRQLGLIGDELDDLVPAFGKTPGSHGESTEFMN